MKEITKEELEDKIKSLVKKKTYLLNDLNKIQLEINSVEEQYLSLSNEFIKIECFNPGCNGTGYIRGEDKKLKACQLCGSKGYRWMKKYVGQDPKKDKE